MPLIRISAAERRGLPLEQKEMATDLGRLAVFAAQSGIRPQRCVSGSLIDLTPPYAVYNAFRPFLEVESAHNPPQAGTIHLMPDADDVETLLLSLAGTWQRAGIRTLRIPQEEAAYIWLAPTERGIGLKLVEIVTVLPEEFIGALDATAQAAQ